MLSCVVYLLKPKQKQPLYFAFGGFVCKGKPLEPGAASAIMVSTAVSVPCRALALALLSGTQYLVWHLCASFVLSLLHFSL